MRKNEAIELIEAESNNVELADFIFNYWVTIPDIKVHYLLTENNNELYIVFRGSDSIQDWIFNFMFLSRKVFPYGNRTTKIRLHSGFYFRYYYFIRSTIHCRINTRKYSKVYVIGHSLGGAMAQLCAVDIDYNFDVPIECITLGSPKVGNKAFVESYNNRVPDTINYVNDSDIVPMLPPTIFGFFACCPTRIGKKGFIPSFKNHSLEAYEKAKE